MTTVAELKRQVVREDFGPDGQEGDELYAEWRASHKSAREVLLEYASDVGGIWDHEGPALEKALVALERP